MGVRLDRITATLAMAGKMSFVAIWPICGATAGDRRLHDFQFLPTTTRP
jgi:hypothetical protein